MSTSHVACGTEDFTWPGNRRFLTRAAERGIAVSADVDRSGDHEWGYWDARLRDVLSWLPLTG